MPTAKQFKTIEEYIKTIVLLGGAAVVGYHFYGLVGAVLFPVALFCGVVIIIALIGISIILVVEDATPTEKTNTGEAE